MAQPEARPVSEVVLSGPGSADDELVESLGVHLGLPVERGRAARRLDSSAPRPRRRPLPLHGGRRPGPGSCSMKPVNLLPRTSAGARQATAARQRLRRLRRARRAARDGRRLRAHQNKVTEHKDKTAGPAPRPTGSRPRPPRRPTFGDFASIKQTRVAVRPPVAAARFDWERFMRELVARAARGQLAAGRRRIGDRRRRRHRRADRRNGPPPARPTAEPRRLRARHSPTWPR